MKCLMLRKPHNFRYLNIVFQPKCDKIRYGKKNHSGPGQLTCIGLFLWIFINNFAFRKQISLGL